jgi:hypothetical protein
LRQTRANFPLRRGGHWGFLASSDSGIWPDGVAKSDLSRAIGRFCGISPRMREDVDAV